jgi:hypothetical protein
MPVDLEDLIATFPFGTPNTPDLGCFVRRNHEFQVDGEFPLWAEFAPWTTAEGIIPHQVYFRVICGRAAFHQRVKVWMRPELDPFIFGGIDPDHVLGGDFRPRPSDWTKSPPHRSNLSYWFRGEHRNPAAGVWGPAAAAGHSFDVDDNGTLSTARWDDTGGDRDFNDIIVEVAVVHRRRYFDQVLAPVAAANADEYERFVGKQFEDFRSSDRPTDDLRAV